MNRSWKKFLPELTVRLSGKETDFKKTSRTVTAKAGESRPVKKQPEKEYLLVDGYNIIFCMGRFKRTGKS